MSGEFIDMCRKFLRMAGHCCTWVALCNQRLASQVMLLVLGIAGPEGRYRTLPKVHLGPMKRMGPHVRDGKCNRAHTACSGTNQNGS